VRMAISGVVAGIRREVPQAAELLGYALILGAMIEAVGVIRLYMLIVTPFSEVK